MYVHLNSLGASTFLEVTLEWTKKELEFLLEILSQYYKKCDNEVSKEMLRQVFDRAQQADKTQNFSFNVYRQEADALIKVVQEGLVLKSATLKFVRELGRKLEDHKSVLSVRSSHPNEP